MKPVLKQIIEITLGVVVVLLFVYAGIYAGKLRYELLHLNTSTAVTLGPAQNTVDDVTNTIQDKIIPADSFNPYFIEQYVNNVRQASGLPALRHNALLEKSAQAKLNDMLAKDYFAHTSPQGQQPWDFMTEQGYRYVAAGENLAKADYKDEQAVVDAWVDSPDHYLVMMSKKYCDVGVAIHKVKQPKSEPSLYVVVMHVASNQDTATLGC